MSHDAVRRLIALAEEAAAATPDLPGEIAAAISTAMHGPGDPWLLIGVLVEGIAETIKDSIPAERRQECVAAALALLVERSRGGGG
ncbi:MAG TPA: hypothetical protein VMB34_06335 [Acetobacteraceae bacterium]|jgi:hypothetical protein|nr:hypothetical protein [Acetobacteraceae bacterium]